MGISQNPCIGLSGLKSLLYRRQVKIVAPLTRNPAEEPGLEPSASRSPEIAFCPTALKFCNANPSSQQVAHLEATLGSLPRYYLHSLRPQNQDISLSTCWTTWQSQCGSPGSPRCSRAGTTELCSPSFGFHKEFICFLKPSGMIFCFPL